MGHQFQKRTNPAYAWMMGVPFGSEEQKELLESDVQRFGKSKGTAGDYFGRYLNTALDPVAAASAAAQGVAEVPRAVWKSFKPDKYASKEQRAKDAQEGKEAAAAQQQKEGDFGKQLKGAPRDLHPSSFTRTKYAYGQEDPDAPVTKVAGKQRMGAAAYFYGIPEVDKEKAMAMERKVASDAGREPRSWEEVKAIREHRSDKDWYFTDEDRAAYADMAKNDPDKLRSWFDRDQDGAISTRERQLIFDPKTGFRAKLQGEAEKLAAEAEAKAKAEAEAAAAAAWRAELRDELAMGRGAGKAVNRMAKDFLKGPWADAERMGEKAVKEAEAAQLKKERIAFAKGLEGDLGHSYTPNSAFQNPQTRQRIMDEAFVRAEELGVSRPQLRAFLRNKGLLDKGFTESYEDFHARTTAGGGLRTGSVGGRRTVSAPKREGGGIKTEADIANEEDRRRYAIWLHNQRLKEGQQTQPRFTQTVPQIYSPPTQPQ